MLKKEEVEHVASLARIEISEVDMQKLAEQLSAILDYVAELGKAPTENVEPILQINGLKNIGREDKIIESLSVEKVLSNAPEKENNFIKTKQVFE